MTKVYAGTLEIELELNSSVSLKEFLTKLVSEKSLPLNNIMYMNKDLKIAIKNSGLEEKYQERRKQLHNNPLLCKNKIIPIETSVSIYGSEQEFIKRVREEIENAPTLYDFIKTAVNSSRAAKKYVFIGRKYEDSINLEEGLKDDNTLISNDSILSIEFPFGSDESAFRNDEAIMDIEKEAEKKAKKYFQARFNTK